MSGVSAVLKKDENHKPFEFLDPFNRTLWALIVASIVLYGIFLYLTSKLCDHSREDRERLTFWRSLSIVGHAFIQQEGDFITRTVGERIIMVTWRVYSLILIATYTANFTAFLSSSIKDTGITTFGQLLNNEDMRYGMEADTSNYDFFKYSEKDKYREAYKKMKTWDTIYPLSEDIPQSLHRVTTKTAFITDDLTIRLMMKKSLCDPNIYQTEAINFEEQAFVLRRGLARKEEINKYMRQYGRTGYLTKLIVDQWQSCQSTTHVNAVGVDRLYGFFVIMGINAAVAFISPWLVSWDMTRVRIVRLWKRNCARRDLARNAIPAS